MRIEKFSPDDIDRLKNFGGQESVVSMVADMPREHLEKVISVGSHHSFWEGDELIACMGVIDLNRWRGAAWALLQGGRPETFVGVHRCTRRVLWSRPLKRIEAHTVFEDEKAARWLTLLGFEMEHAYKPYFFPDGRAASIWELKLDGAIK